MKDFLVRIVRHGEILIRADNAEEAAAMAGKFGFDSASWDDDFELRVEAVHTAANQDGTSGKVVKVAKDAKSGKKRKKKWTWKCRCEEGDIPF